MKTYRFQYKDPATLNKISSEVIANDQASALKAFCKSFDLPYDGEVPKYMSIIEVHPPEDPDSQTNYIALLGTNDDEAGWGSTPRAALDHALRYDGDQLVEDGDKVPVYTAIAYDANLHSRYPRYVFSKILDGDGSSWIPGQLTETFTIRKNTLIDY